LTATDGVGKPWQIRFVDESGSDPSIHTLPRREIAGRITSLIYNPFYVFPVEAPLERLRYEFTFKGRSGESKVEATVDPIAYEQRVDLILPLQGRQLVFEGHDYYSHHRRWDYTQPIWKQVGVHGNFSRYGYDFSLVDQQGRMYRTDGRRNEDWYSWGVPIHAPGTGLVVATENGMPDYDVGKGEAAGLSIDTVMARPQSLYGNHVVIDHGNGVFSRLFHMMRGSVAVRPGQRVEQGEVVGRVGFSGSVYTVHLHYEVGTGPGHDVEGLPSYFSGFRRVWGRRIVDVARGQVDTGDIVERP
jgi:murein DD-endopeptidase MepM/ murein hydrolase activator NlpD